MKQRNPIVHIAGIICLCIISCKPSSSPTDLSKGNFIPKPVSIRPDGGTFQLEDATTIYFEGDEEVRHVAQYLADKLKPATGYGLPVSPVVGTPEAGNIYLSLKADPQLGAEGYELTITEDQVKVSSPSSV